MQFDRRLCDGLHACVVNFNVDLYRLGVHYVFDTTFSRNFSLLESQREFVKRFRKQAEDKKALPMLASACPGMELN